MIDRLTDQPINQPTGQPTDGQEVHIEVKLPKSLIHEGSETHLDTFYTEFSCNPVLIRLSLIK